MDTAPQTTVNTMQKRCQRKFALTTISKRDTNSSTLPAAQAKRVPRQFFSACSVPRQSPGCRGNAALLHSPEHLILTPRHAVLGLSGSAPREAACNDQANQALHQPSKIAGLQRVRRPPWGCRRHAQFSLRRFEDINGAPLAVYQRRRLAKK